MDTTLDTSNVNDTTVEIPECTYSVHDDLFNEWDEFGYMYTDLILDFECGDNGEW